MNRLEKQKEYFFSIGPSQEDYREILNSLYRHGFIFTETYDSFCEKIEKLKKEINVFSFSDDSVQRKYKKFITDFGELYDYLTYNLHDHRKKEDGLAKHVSYVFRKQKYTLQEDGISEYLKLKSEDSAKNPYEIKTILPNQSEEFVGNWLSFFTEKFQPYINEQQDNFNDFIKELNDKTIFSEKITERENVNKTKIIKKIQVSRDNKIIINKKIQVSRDNKIIINKKIIKLSAAQFLVMEFIIENLKELFGYDELHDEIEFSSDRQNKKYKGYLEAVRDKMKMNQIDDFFSEIGNKQVKINPEYLA